MPVGLSCVFSSWSPRSGESFASSDFHRHLRLPPSFVERPRHPRPQGRATRHVPVGSLRISGRVSVGPCEQLPCRRLSASPSPPRSPARETPSVSQQLSIPPAGVTVASKTGLFRSLVGRESEGHTGSSDHRTFSARVPPFQKGGLAP